MLHSLLKEERVENLVQLGDIQLMDFHILRIGSWDSSRRCEVVIIHISFKFMRVVKKVLGGAS